MRKLLIIAALAARVHGQGQTLQQQLTTIAQQRGMIGMSVVAACDGQVTDAVHVGQRNIAQDLPVNDATRYRIASISKLVTAIGLMRLHEQGAFQLDDDVSPALGFSLRNPAFPGTAITYRMLLTHRASVQDGTGYGNFLTATYASTPPPPIAQLLVPGGISYTANMWRNEAPGSYYNYSNVAYGILGTLIEAHSGQRFDQYMREQVLLPMGINGSYNVQDLDDIAQLSVLYRNSTPQSDNFNGVMPPAPDLSGYTIGSNGLFFAPQGGLRCSAVELMRVATMLLNDGAIDGTTVLQPATVQAMLANEWTWNGSNGNNYYGLFRSWGLGAHRITAQPGGDVVFPGTLMYGHAGEAYGLISDLYFDPQSHFALVFISNGYTPGNSYVLGASSAFYQVEEEAYAALASTALAGCLAMSAGHRGREDEYALVGRSLHWRGSGELVCDAVDFNGRLLERFSIWPGGHWAAADSLGPLLVRGLRADGSAITVRMN